ncbi:MAG TPA: 30S ribosomal protein S24e [Candidatus Bathyarchaeia archaeon]|nr:30S ribosomal protein S24e [Candidatus Bathyarchaeia archaeon]
MEVTITQQQYNPLLKRKEIAFTVDHKQTRGTPTRLEVRDELAQILKAKPEVVYVKRIGTKAGTMTATGEANAYDSVEQAKRIEPKYIIERNTPKEKKEETEKTEAQPPPTQKTEQPAKTEG